MPHQFADYLVVGISSRALFDLEEENRIYNEQGLKAYSEYQQTHEQDVLKPGSGFPLVKALLRLNQLIPGQRKTEIIVMSKNAASTSLRIFNSIEHYGLDISRAALTGGSGLSSYLTAFNTDLFLSADAADVQEAINANIAAGIICTDSHPQIDVNREITQLRIAFDGDAVLFSPESERIFQEQGKEAFLQYERENAHKPLAAGPFAPLLKSLSYLQQQFASQGAPIRTALVTARNAPAHERVILTLREWNIDVDETFFLGGMEKSAILKAFGADIFFDDQSLHTNQAAPYVPAARVPYKQE